MGIINKKEKEQAVSRREKIHRILAYSKVFFPMTLSDKRETVFDTHVIRKWKSNRDCI